VNLCNLKVSLNYVPLSITEYTLRKWYYNSEVKVKPIKITGSRQQFPCSKKMVKCRVIVVLMEVVKEHVPPCVILVINNNPYGLMIALSYVCRTCP
jgi:hypothetical protein